MTKSYSTHTVTYRGDIDENGIWGTWELEMDLSKIPQDLQASVRAAFKDQMIGGFHIWPEDDAVEAKKVSQKENTSSDRLQEIFIKVFGLFMKENDRDNIYTLDGKS